MLSILKRLNRYTTMATGDFEKIFADFHVPSCPEIVTKLLALFGLPSTVGNVSKAASMAGLKEIANLALPILLTDWFDIYQRYSSGERRAAAPSTRWRYVI